MRWCSCISRRQKLKDSLEEICDSVLELLGQEPDIVFVFVSGYSRTECETLPSVLKARLKGVVFGCTGHGIIGGDEEIERA
jgi:small ligand-binding sensory domain FIST